MNLNSIPSTFSITFIIKLLSALSLITTSICFSPSPSPTQTKNNHHHRIKSSSSLHSYRPTSKSSSSSFSSLRRESILNRSGSHFKLNRFNGNVEFGSTVNLITKFDYSPSYDLISDWISDEKRVATSIWDEKLLTEKGNSIYTLELMKLQFVTIQLSPKVDTKMWIDVSDVSGDGRNVPMFKLQSIDFDPNIELLPGLNIKPESLSIDIEVVGELQPSENGLGVEGKIGFVSSGELPPPMRLLPEGILKGASDLICKTVSDFAIKNFQTGARRKYKEFVIMKAKKDE